MPGFKRGFQAWSAKGMNRSCMATIINENAVLENRFNRKPSRESIRPAKANFLTLERVKRMIDCRKGLRISHFWIAKFRDLLHRLGCLDRKLIKLCADSDSTTRH